MTKKDKALVEYYVREFAFHMAQDRAFDTEFASLETSCRINNIVKKYYPNILFDHITLQLLRDRDHSIFQYGEFSRFLDKLLERIEEQEEK